MFCMKCGQSLAEDALFCSKCGAKITIQKEKEKHTDVLENNSSVEKLTTISNYATNLSENTAPKNTDGNDDKLNIKEVTTKSTVLSQDSSQNESPNRSKRNLIIGLLVFITIITFIVSAITINNDPERNDIVLTQENKELVELIYNKRKVWERKPNGSLCQYCYFQNVNGSLYFECAFNDSASKKYKISNNVFAEHDYLKDNQGFMSGRLLTLSMPNYDYYASDEEKYTYVENLVKEMQDPQKWQEMKSKR